MFRSILLPTMFVIAALSGCLGGGDDEPSPTPGPDGGTGANQTLSLQIINYTAEANSSEPVNVTWEVMVEDDPNATVQLNHTDVHYGNMSEPDPQGAGNYTNTTEEQSGPPGQFNATFTVEGNGTFYVRAHAVLNGTDHWSEEVVVQISPGVPPVGDVVEVDISGVSFGSVYNPDELTIQVGDGVRWMNGGLGGFAHTATSNAGAPQAFDTGSIAQGATSAVIQFTVPGTYAYHCSFHQQTMSASITVEA